MPTAALSFLRRYSVGPITNARVSAQGSPCKVRLAMRRPRGKAADAPGTIDPSLAFSIATLLNRRVNACEYGMGTLARMKR